MMRGAMKEKKKLHYNLYDRFHFSRLFRIAVPALTVRLWHKRAKIFRPVSYTLNCTRNRDYNFSTPSNINMMMFVNRFLFATIFTRKKNSRPCFTSTVAALHSSVIPITSFSSFSIHAGYGWHSSSYLGGRSLTCQKKYHFSRQQK